MKTILITGGAGFIGSHLCESLLAQGHHIICLDNFFTGSKKNVDRFLSNPRFEVLRHDITQPLYIECDQIYNLACPASPIHYQYNPIKTIKCSTVGMVNMLGLAKRTKARILQTSTSEVYGDPLEHPQKETYWGNVNMLGPRACYDEGKRVAEALCMAYHHQNQVDIRLVRIFNTYGQNMALNDGRVISNFIVQALQNRPITIFGDGSQTRSFCYVTDLIGGLQSMMNAEGLTGPINLGNNQEYSILEIAKKIITLTGSRSIIRHEKLPLDDPHQRKPDLTLAKEKLGWTPTTPLDDGLKATITYFREQLS